uniref:RING finger and transmembrane domain-containing protein 2-like isoform X2 n=1 Tax=Erigeron canadensis TaxID=72917 RepID=UPI001CB98DC3|nr:RING finger and transmembrane domain-containing protein 2-like isoform X2 [Erigeron canadensis]
METSSSLSSSSVTASVRGSSASTSSNSTSSSSSIEDNLYDVFRRNNNNVNNSRFSTSRFFRSPVSTFLDYIGVLQPATTRSQSSDSLNNGGRIRNDDDSGELSSIRIVGSGEEHNETVRQSETLVQSLSRTVSAMALDNQGESRSGLSSIRGSSDTVGSGSVDVEAGAAADGVNNINNNNNNNSPYQRYDIQQAARWAEQILPFSFLLLVVFIRQHLQGFFVTFYIAAFLFKSNDILRHQTSLKGERKVSVLVSLSFVFTLHVAWVYWWCQKDEVLNPLVMLPPTTIPPFWHAIFIIMVNDTMARQAAMVLKCFLLMYYKNNRGRNRRKQGQMLTLVEYLFLLYRALLPAPVWYRFFLNKEYGSLFSSLMTGLYLTFKLTSVVEKVQSFISAINALSRKEIHYGVYATSEQVNAVGDLCAICQEKMHAPVVLRCKHVFCEECVSEWFERERTCPLCRSLVRPADLRSFGDGSTSLYFQLF